MQRPSQRAAWLSAAPDFRPDQGFTLLEVLIVLVISAILVTAVVLSVGATGERQIANASERLQALLGHACNQAELSGREIGALIGADGYSFLRLDGDGWRALPADGELRARRWPTGLRIELSRDGRPVALETGQQNVPQVVCFSSGEATPFVLTMTLGDSPLRYRLSGADDGTVKAERIEAAQ